MPMCRVAVVALTLACAQAALASASTFAVVRQPDFISCNEQATLLSADDVPEVIKASLGLNADVSWDGITRKSPFKVPNVALHLAIASCGSECLPEESAARFPVFSSSRQAQTHADTLFAPVTSAFGADSYSAPSARQHSSGELAGALSALNAVPGVSVQGSVIVVEGYSLHVHNQHVAPLVSDILNLLDALSAASSSTQRKKPVVVAQTLNLFSVPHAAAAALVKAVASYVSTSALHSDGALVTMFCEDAEEPVRVARRDMEQQEPSNPDNPGLTPLDPAWVEHCAEYQCYCSTDSEGMPWDPDTRCKQGCEGDHCECVYLGCNCTTGRNVNKAMAKCKTCKDGFVLIGTHCYLDSDMPVAVNIILILGVITFVAFLVTCWVLADMDPGYDSIIYRMTQQRIKSQ